MLRWLALLLALSSLGACGTRRAYPALSFVPVGTRDRAVELELGAATRLSHDLLLAIDEGDARTAYEIRPDPAVDRSTVGSADPLDLFRMVDPSHDCPEEGAAAVRCRYRNYRARVPMRPRPIAWLAGEDGKVVLPHHIEDLAPFPCEGTCVIGVTEFTTTGRLTKFRQDQVAKGRDATERLFVLRRTRTGWEEVRLGVVERMRQNLSDWGRASCGEDMVVEGLAVDPAVLDVYVGVRRCDGSAQTVLRYPLGQARRGGVATFEVLATGIRDGYGIPVAGPTEGLSSLDWAHGTLWATTSWDDYGDPVEPVYGSRLLVLDGDHLTPVPLPAALKDRADALVLLPTDRPTAASGAPSDLFPDVHALLFFDNDAKADLRNGTLVHAFTPRPPDGRPIGLRSLSPASGGADPVGLNGFDFRWYLRDHRLGQLTAVADRREAESGAWTAALGGLWQVRLGTLARATRPVLGKAVGHNRQAVALTDYSPAEELDFSAWRAVLTVVPRERTGDEVSIAHVMAEQVGDYEVEVELPAVPPGSGLVLQGVSFDTASRAAGGICLSALDVGVRWVDPEDPGPAVLRAMLLGGLCNDFNAQDAEEHHGLTTEPRAGVRVALYFAIVEGAEAQQGSLILAQRDRPGPRVEPAGIALHEGEPLPPPPAYVRRTAPERISNHRSKDNLVCARVDGDAAELVEPPSGRYLEAGDSSWLAQVDGALPTGAGEGRAGSLSGFAFALDLRSFDPDAPDSTWDGITELMARSQNVYLYRYLLRAWAEEGLFVEGGMSHGLHLSGPGKDNASPTALYVRTDLTWWDGLSDEPIDLDLTPPVGRMDPNLQPEDGFLRWAPAVERDEELSCLEH